MTASDSVASSAREARVIRASRSAIQQHSICRTWSTPATRMPPRTSAATTASPAPKARQARARSSAAAAISAAPPDTHAHAGAWACSHSAAATAAAAPAITT